MAAYIFRRLLQSLLTILGVMLITFILFRVVAGDIASAHLGPKATQEQKAEWMQQKGYDKPAVIQFLHYTGTTVTLQNTSLVTEQKLTTIVWERAPYSLAITVPAMAIGWILAMTISTVVAYYRASLIDNIGVLVAVLGMCIPYLGFIIAIQYFMFRIKPSMAYGLADPLNILVPVAIAVVAGLGHNVRFYRAVILDETQKDYVRTARAKGVPLPGVMFKHILRNCMLPILTNLIMAIPFLIMGSLLLERFFAVPGLGDLLLSSITSRDEPIISGLTFFTAAVYVFGTLLTDISYAVFDPRVRLS